MTTFANPKKAEAAGFRPCRRCRPHDARTEADQKVVRACAIITMRIEEDPSSRLTLDELAQLVGWSPGHLHRSFSRIVGVSPRAFADVLRLKRAKAALRDGGSVLTATFDGGFGSGKALYDRAEEAFGMSPGVYRRGAEGLVIRYAVFDTALGSVLVAATKRGVCAVSLGDDPESLIRDLEIEFASAEIVRHDGALGPWAEPVLRFLAGAPGHPSEGQVEGLLGLPTDVYGTVFQRRVWAALRDIPIGETRTYSEVASAIGRPGAARAVAGACGSNRLAVVVPCHRVIGSDGGLRGYRWGTERKRVLLEREQEFGNQTNRHHKSDSA